MTTVYLRPPYPPSRSPHGGPDRNLLPDGRPAGPLIEVLRLVAEGLTNGRIGERLNLAEDSVKSRLRVLYRAFRVTDRAAAVAEGFRRGYLGDVEHGLTCAALAPRRCTCGASPTETEVGH